MILQNWWYTTLLGFRDPIRPQLRADIRADVLIVGGGAAGLAAALRLRSSGARVVLLETNESARDKHLKSDAFFDVDKHPTITFQSTRVRKVGDKTLKIAGNLTMRGTTKPVTLDVETLGIGRDGYGGFRAGFEARARINRHDFGVSWNDIVEGGGLMVGNEVEIILSLEAVRQKALPAEDSKGRS